MDASTYSHLLLVKTAPIDNAIGVLVCAKAKQLPLEHQHVTCCSFYPCGKEVGVLMHQDGSTLQPRLAAAVAPDLSALARGQHATILRLADPFPCKIAL